MDSQRWRSLHFPMQGSVSLTPIAAARLGVGSMRTATAEATTMVKTKEAPIRRYDAFDGELIFFSPFEDPKRCPLIPKSAGECNQKKASPASRGALSLRAITGIGLV